MVNLYINPNLSSSQANGEESYSGFKEPDTKVPPKAKPVLDSVSVNGIEIPEADILAEAQHHPADNPGDALEQAVQALVVRELLLQRAEELGFVPDPSTDTVSVPETPQDSLIRQVTEHEIATPKATEKECRRYYRNNPDRFSSDTIYEASHILLSCSKDDNLNRKGLVAKAGIIIAQLQDNPEEFERLAAEFSACPSANQGGNLGQLIRGSTVDEFEQAIENADGTGLLPHPVESKYGVHIIRLDRVLPGSVVPYENVKEQIADWLEATTWSKGVSQYLHLLASDAEISGITFPNSNFEQDPN